MHGPTAGHSEFDHAARVAAPPVILVGHARGVNTWRWPARRLVRGGYRMVDLTEVKLALAVFLEHVYWGQQGLDTELPTQPEGAAAPPAAQVQKIKANIDTMELLKRMQHLASCCLVVTQALHSTSAQRVGMHALAQAAPTDTRARCGAALAVQAAMAAEVDMLEAVLRLANDRDVAGHAEHAVVKAALERLRALRGGLQSLRRDAGDLLEEGEALEEAADDVCCPCPPLSLGMHWLTARSTCQTRLIRCPAMPLPVGPYSIDCDIGALAMRDRLLSAAGRVVSSVMTAAAQMLCAAHATCSAPGELSRQIHRALTPAVPCMCRRMRAAALTTASARPRRTAPTSRCRTSWRAACWCPARGCSRFTTATRSGAATCCRTGR